MHLDILMITGKGKFTTCYGKQLCTCMYTDILTKCLKSYWQLKTSYSDKDVIEKKDNKKKQLTYVRVVIKGYTCNTCYN